MMPASPPDDTSLPARRSTSASRRYFEWRLDQYARMLPESRAFAPRDSRGASALPGPSNAPYLVCRNRDSRASTASSLPAFLTLPEYFLNHVSLVRPWTRIPWCTWDLVTSM